MAEDLGVHEDHLPPVSTGSSGTPSVDFESRRRPRIFSLSFGRAPMTCMNQLDVDAPKNLDSHISHPAPMNASPLRTSISPVTPPRPIQLPHGDSIAACTLLLQKQAQLGKVIEEIQCQSHFSTRKPLCQSASWIEAVYSKLNARLLGWYDSLPGELRWSRWSSNLDTLEPDLATLHVMYQTTRLRLNRPLLGRKRPGISSKHRSNAICQAFDMCEDSVETIAGILRRFSVQHTLKNAPLVFVYGLIAAIDASLAMASGRVPEDGAHPLPGEAVLLAMDTMLLELSHSWRIAGDARNGLRDRLQQVQRETTTPRDDKSTSTPSTSTGISPDFRDYYAAEPGTIFAPCAQALPQDSLWCGNNQELDLEILGASDLEFDMSSVFQYGGGLANLRTF
ncbi:hypothetical protein LTS15_004314 [Exophiala xenobiotica]|nr:hypothetical protein LTS15_004314 [Exophiala xenobiotica]